MKQNNSARKAARAAEQARESILEQYFDRPAAIGRPWRPGKLRCLIIAEKHRVRFPPHRTTEDALLHVRCPHTLALAQRTEELPHRLARYDSGLSLPNMHLEIGWKHEFHPSGMKAFEPSMLAREWFALYKDLVHELPEIVRLAVEIFCLEELMIARGHLPNRPRSYNTE